MKTQHQLLRTVNRELEAEFKQTAELSIATKMFQHVSEKLKHGRTETSTSQTNSLSPDAKDVSTLSSKVASQLCRRSNQEAWSRVHGKEVAKTEDSLIAVAGAVYELAQSGSALAEGRKVITTLIGLGVNLSPKLLARALAAFLQRDITQSRVSHREWIQFSTHETTITSFLDRQRRKLLPTDPMSPNSRKKQANMSQFSASVQRFLQDFQQMVAMVNGWWYETTKRGGGQISAGKVAQSLADIGCFSNPSEAMAGLQRVSGSLVSYTQDDFSLLFVRAMIKTTLLALAKVLSERWKGSGMSLSFQLAMLKKNLIMSGLGYKNALLGTTLESETVVTALDQASTALFQHYRPSFREYQQEMREVLVKRKDCIEQAKMRTMSAGPTPTPRQHAPQELYTQTLKNMQDVVSYIPDVNLFLVMAD